MTAPTLTTDQAEAMARCWALGEDGGDMAATVAVSPSGAVAETLARWIIRAAPVVRAAETTYDAMAGLQAACEGGAALVEDFTTIVVSARVVERAAVRAYRDGQPADVGAATMQERIDLAQGFIEGLCGDGAS